MKTLRIGHFVLICFTLLTGCTRFWDVHPNKEIYSPIDFSYYTVEEKKGQYGSFLKDSASVSFSIVEKDTSLKYGLLAFYDSLSPGLLIKKNLISGPFEFYKALADPSPSSRKLVRKADVKINPIKGQFIYFVLVGYTKDSTISYYSQGYIRVQISPWTHFTDLTGFSTQYQVRLFSANNKLQYVKYTIESMFFYEYDSLANNWIEKGKLSSRLCTYTDCNANQAAGKSVTNIPLIYFRNNQYHILVNTFALGAPNYKYATGEIILDQDFKFKAYSEFSYSVTPLNYHLADLQSDTLRLLYRQPNIRTRGGIEFGESDLSGFYRYPADATARTYYPITDELNPTGIFMLIGSKLLVTAPVQKTFSVVDLSRGQFKTEPSIPYPSTDLIWQPDAQARRFVVIPEGNQAYLMNNNLNLYRITFSSPTTLAFTDQGLSWFPANSPTAFNQGFLYKGKLIYLVNDYQLWSLDPNRLSGGIVTPDAVSVVRF